MTKDKIKEFVITNFLFGDLEQSFTDDDSFLSKGIIDSTGILELINFIEEEYGIVIEDEETIPDNLDSLNNISLFIEKKQNE